MAEKRMFSNKVIGSDAFLEMPDSTQNLYFHLSMYADDDGFVDKPKSIMRMTGKKEDDLKLLIAKSFIIPFDTGIVVIRHWRLNNYLRSDRYKETQYLQEKSTLTLSENGEYELGIPKVSIDKDSIDKISIEENNIYSDEQEVFDFWNSMKIIVHKELNDDIRKSITKSLKKHSLEMLKVYISRYAMVIKDNRYFFDYKWSLKDLLDRKNGISAFSNEGSKWLDYCNKVGISPETIPSEIAKEKEIKVDNNGVFSIWRK